MTQDVLLLVAAAGLLGLGVYVIGVVLWIALTGSWRLRPSRGRHRQRANRK